MKQKPLPTQYNTNETETRWQQHWLNAGTYHWHNDAPREQTYVIDTPPPTVSGHLHMGHVFSYVQADIIARYQRMTGMDVFYPMGFDDNGLPTERLVEKIHKKRATDYGSREEFIAVCEGVSEEARKDFRQLFQTLALSVDWRQEYHTISKECRALSQQSFLDLLEKGHIERRLQPFFWDPVDQTAIAQAEMEDKELDSFWNDIWFGIEGADEKILIGTTRPELIPACVGIFYHPDDARYQHLKGKHAITPLFGVRVPILEDDSVEPDKGTGIMMCCTFGDEADIEKWRKHKLPMRVILNKYGKLDFSQLSSCERGSAAQDLDSAQSQSDSQNDIYSKLLNKKVTNRDPKHPGARETIIEMLRESGDLEESKPIKHSVKCAERSGAPLEIIPTEQWFVKLTDQKEALIARARECNWYPDWMRLRIEQWTQGLSADWCISRQRYYGVPFPVWHAESQNTEASLEKTKYILPSIDELPINPLSSPPKGYEIVSRIENSNSWLCKDKDDVEWLIRPDADVMDTWATSSISPQINASALNVSSCGQPKAGAQDLGDSAQSLRDSQNDRFNKLFPADLRPQAHEIIRTWAFYTLAKAHLHNDSIPWKNLMISGWCLAEDKTKMSKSKGNVVTPTELIQQQGTDAVRYWAATSRLGQDTAYSPDLLKIGKKLVTKLWNATKFAAIHLEKLPDDFAQSRHDVITETLDQWILSRLHQAIKKSTESFEKYEYADALRATEDFFWNDFCDNYLELVKRRVYGNEHEDSMSESALSSSHGEAKQGRAGDNAKQLSAVVAIYQCLDGILKLFAPFVPHITEELYSHIFAEAYEAKGSLHGRYQWPNAAAISHDASAERSCIAAVEILEAIRKAKSEKGVSIKYPIEKLVVQTLFDGDEAVTTRDIDAVADDLCGAANALEIIILGPNDEFPQHDYDFVNDPESADAISARFKVGIVFSQNAEAS